MAPAPRKSSTRSAPAAGSMADIPRASAISSRSTTDGSDSAVNWIPAQRRDCDGRDDTMTNRHRMSPLHIALAVLVMAIWGTNFVVIKIGLRDFPPFLFALLRFFFCAMPFAFLVPPPPLPLPRPPAASRMALARALRRLSRRRPVRAALLRDARGHFARP